MDKQREKLIELIIKGSIEYANSVNSDGYMRYVADYLLANGVIVPPCKVGDTVWLVENIFDGAVMRKVLASRRIDCIGGNSLNPIWMVSSHPYEIRFHPSEFGKTVFFSKEDAEKALEELKGGDT